MFLEALASLADDLSYLQDRIAAEAWLETATERRSVTRLARLVDYEPRPATAARVWLAFEMAPLATGPIPAGIAVSGQAPDGTPIHFETGTGLDDEALLPGPGRVESHRTVLVGRRTALPSVPGDGDVDRGSGVRALPGTVAAARHRR